MLSRKEDLQNKSLRVSNDAGLFLLSILHLSAEALCVGWLLICSHFESARRGIIY
jgi:hypothetical protein